ncbi:MAG: urea transporter [Flavobacteriales bacterium]|nr:urea transporter [Flavobacteriales bacterium]
MNYIQSILRSLGQVMFQNNSYSGLLFLIGIFYNSAILGAAAVLGTIISIGTAQIFKYSTEDIQNVLYGLNGALTGIAMWYFFGFTTTTFFALIIGSALTTPLYYYLKKIIPPFTAPFIIISWIVMYLLLLILKVPFLSSTTPPEQTFNFLFVSAKSFGQVMFQDNTITGLLFLLAILVNSKRSAVYGLYAAILGSLFGLLLKEPVSVINAGLMGYNAILCAIALADEKRNSFFWISIATMISVILNIGFSKLGIIALTAPFVLSTWIILKLKLHKRQPATSYS